jgi:acetoacetate decarboxylase
MTIIHLVHREFSNIVDRNGPHALKAVIPAPLELTEDTVKYECIRMPDTTRFTLYLGTVVYNYFATQGKKQ